MDKNAIKKYAVWARRELISRVTQKALQYGITEEEMVSADAASVNGVALTTQEKEERQTLIAKINAEGFEQVMEEVAYTWFNRFSALRFMEVNGYLPTHVRVFTDEENNFKPQILAEAINLEMDGLDMEKVYALKDANDKDALFKYLIITQCNALSTILPGMFQKIDDYTELLFPDNLLREGSVIQQMIALIPEDDWKDAVQIIGWMYQYYNAEKKDEVFAALKKNIKITKENIPAATQLFTPDWIVRYMVENSLGRLWIEGHPNDELKSTWKYYLDEAEQEPDVQIKLAEIRKEYAAIRPEEIKCIDPCMGSGHILTYMFDVLVQIYEDYGYTTREAVTGIVQHNIYGLDIDERAAQLANFAIMMKAVQYDNRFLKRKDEDGNPSIPQPHVYSIIESNTINRDLLSYFGEGLSELERNTARLQLEGLLDILTDAKEYGSILNVENYNWELLYRFIGNFTIDWQMSFEAIRIDEMAKELRRLVELGAVMGQKYSVVVTNPPYLGNSGMNSNLTKYMNKHYPDSKSDLFAAFIEKCGAITAKNCYQAMITQHSWMFLSSFEKLRSKNLLIDTVNMAHLGARAFEEIGGEVVQTTSFVFRNSQIKNAKGVYLRLVEPTSQNGKENMFLAGENRFESAQSNFSKIPGSPIAYWVSERIIDAFITGIPLGEKAISRNGMKTGENDRFVRCWYEINKSRFKEDAINAQIAINSKAKWFPYNKGGEYRKWYGNNEYVLNWENEGQQVMQNARMEKRNVQDYPSELKFSPSGSWGLISSGSPSFRYKQYNISDIAGMSFYTNRSDVLYFLAFCNTPIANQMLQILAPTINYQAGDIGRLPLYVATDKYDDIIGIVEENINISKTDWDAFETSWDFTEHPIVRLSKSLWDATAVGASMSYYYGGQPQVSCPLELCYMLWQGECNERFNQLKANEEELNRIFIDIYGLQDELTPEVEDKDVTVRKADLQRDIRSLISYAVGCMFGRYSLDIEGLAYAGGEWDMSKYQSFPADKDNVIPICDDEYFEDDITGLFVRFIETVYGESSLEDNLRFIADALGGKGTPKEVIRNYFLNEFFANHCKIYQKRPIYWLFDSGKKNGFKALVYMHRYQPDTIARMRTDYVHEQQSRYRTAIADLEKRMETAATSERVKLDKQFKKLREQADELHEYEEKIHHLADQYISIDLDDGVKVNYAKFQDVLAKIK